jgi:hypothetical protein
MKVSAEREEQIEQDFGGWVVWVTRHGFGLSNRREIPQDAVISSGGQSERQASHPQVPKSGDYRMLF